MVINVPDTVGSRSGCPRGRAFIADCSKGDSLLLIEEGACDC